MRKKKEKTNRLRKALAEIGEFALICKKRSSELEQDKIAQQSTMIAEISKLKEEAKISQQILVQTLETKLSYEKIIKASLGDKSISDKVQAIISAQQY